MRLALIQEKGEPEFAFSFAPNRLTSLANLAKMARPELSDLCKQAIAQPLSTLWLETQIQQELTSLFEQHRQTGLPDTPFDGVRFLPPVAKPGKIIAVGRNYRDHVSEGQEIWAKRGRQVKLPEFPSAFAKYPSSLIGHREEICLPSGVDDLDYEIELAVIIGRSGLNVSPEDALNHVAGYTICNDLSARSIQFREMETQIGISLAKNFPTFAPLGPFFVTASAVGDPQSLDLTLSVDGETRQKANTRDMIFPVAELVSYWSQTGLEPGDILITGTPAGVAVARPDPQPFFLREGQSVRAEISGLSALENKVGHISQG